MMACCGAWCPEQYQVCSVQLLRCTWGTRDSLGAVEDVAWLC